MVHPAPGTFEFDRTDAAFMRRTSLSGLFGALPVETYVVSFTVVLWVVLTFAAPNFLIEANVTNMMRHVSVAAIIAIGVLCTIVIAGIDLSVGSVAAFCGVLMAQVLSHGFGVPLSVGLALLAGTGIGVINGLGVGVLCIPAFIVTLAGLQVFRGLALLTSGRMTVGGLPPGIKDFARGSVLGIPNLFLTMLGVAVVAHYLLRYTRTGRYLYAIGSNAEASRRQGIPVLRITLIAYMIRSSLAALGAVLLVSRLSVASPSMANAYELQAIAAAVVGGASLFGGRGTVTGAIAGAVLFPTMSNGAVLMDIDPFWEMVLEGLLITLVIYLDNLQKKRLNGT